MAQERRFHTHILQTSEVALCVGGKRNDVPEFSMRMFARIETLNLAITPLSNNKPRLGKSLPTLDTQTGMRIACLGGS
jgi:hypothetical protein